MSAATYTYDRDAARDVVTPTSVALGFQWTASAGRWVGVGVRLTDSTSGIFAAHSSCGGAGAATLPARVGLLPGTAYSFRLEFWTDDREVYSDAPPVNLRLLGTVVVSVTTPAE